MDDCQSSQLRLTSTQADSLIAFLTGRGLACQIKPIADPEAGSEAMSVIVTYPDAAAESVTEWQRLPASSI